MTNETVAALIGAVVGSLGSAFGLVWVEWCRERRNTKGAAMAIAAEVSALIQVIEHRRLLEAVSHWAQSCREQKAALRFKIRVKEDYLLCTKAHVERIGQFNEPLPTLISSLLSHSKSAAEDLNRLYENEGVVKTPDNADADWEECAMYYSELHEVLEQVVHTGKEMIAAANRLYGN